MSVLVIITNVPDRDCALRIARELVERKLAACVNIQAACTSVYRWNGIIETANEVSLLIKTRTEIYPDVEAAIKSLHPYELPEILALPVSAGSSDYMDWIGAQTVTEIS